MAQGHISLSSVEANDRLVLPSDGPALDRKQWRAKPLQSPELLPMLDSIKTLATGGLTSMHVVGDFLKRRIVLLQRRTRLCCWFTGLNDIGRIQREPGTDLSWEELELLVKGITGESFVPESLILPRASRRFVMIQGCKRRSWPRCRPSMRAAWQFIRLAVGTPSAGFGSPVYRLGVPSPPVRPLVPVPPWPPAPWTRAKGLRAAPPPQVVLKGK
jgi:hypothetical protein